MKTHTLIKKLLITEEKVTIPGYGSFIAKHKSAEIDDKTGEIKPPTKEITFDANQKEDDGLLRGALVASGITEEEASKELIYFKNTIETKLSSNEKFEIDDIGFLTKDKKGTILFTQTENTSLLPENVGLASIQFGSDEINKVTKINTTQKPPKEKKEKKEKNKTKSKKIVKSLLVALPIVAIIALLAIFHKPIIEKGKQIFAGTKDTTEVIDDSNNVIADNNNNSDNNNVDNTNDNSNIDNTNDNNVDNTNDNNLENELGNDDEYRKLLDAKISNTADVNLGNSFKKFYIIVGSFSMKENATKYKNELTNQGYDVTIINGTEFFRVAIGGYDKADNLIAEYSKIKNKYGNGIWILINR